jgi:hypothetical protein
VAYTPFPSDIDDDNGVGFILDDDVEVNSEVKLRRTNIANEMWKSYLDYMADTETSNSDSDDNISDLGE